MQILTKLSHAKSTLKCTRVAAGMRSEGFACNKSKHIRGELDAYRRGEQQRQKQLGAATRHGRNFCELLLQKKRTHKILGNRWYCDVRRLRITLISHAVFAKAHEVFIEVSRQGEALREATGLENFFLVGTACVAALVGTARVIGQQGGVVTHVMFKVWK